MKRLYANFFKGVALTAALAVSSNVYAAEIAGYIENGTQITIDLVKGGPQPSYEFIPTEDCTLEIATDYSSPMLAGHSGNTLLYYGPDHNLTETVDERVPCDYKYEGENGFVYGYNLEGNGELSYYFHYAPGPYLGDQKSITFTFYVLDPQAPAITDLFPAPSSVAYDVVLNPELQMMFNHWGTFSFGSDTNLSYVNTDGSTGSVALDYRVEADGRYVAWKVREALKAARTAEVSPIAEGARFYLNITSPKIDGEPVEGNFVNEEGTIVIEYSYRKVTSITNITVPSTFLSYWPAGTEEAMFILEFDGNLLPMGSYATRRDKVTFDIFAGPYQEPSGEGDDSGWPTLPGATMKISQNMVRIDLSGVVRPAEGQLNALKILTEGDPANHFVNLWIQNLVDINGNAVDFEYAGYSGPLVQVNNIPFVYLEKVPVVSDWTPGTGSLANLSSVGLWISAETLERVSVDGFEYLVPDQEEPIATVSLEEAYPYDAGDGMEYSIPVPPVVKATAGEIILNVLLSSTDGYEYELSTAFTNPASGESGVETAVAEEGETIVYGIDGVRFDASRGLAPGLYIINGKKVIRK